MTPRVNSMLKLEVFFLALAFVIPYGGGRLAFVFLNCVLCGGMEL